MDTSRTPQSEKLIRGDTIEFGGAQLVFAPLNLEAMEEREEDFAAIGTIRPTDFFMSRTQIDAFSRIVLASLNRNYQNITIEDVKKYVDAENLGEIMDAICVPSGLRRKRLGEATAPPPGGPNGGGTSMVSSSPAPAGTGGPSQT